MKTLMAGAVAVLVLGISAGAANAQTLEKMVSPPFPTDVGTDGACYIRNKSTTPANVSVVVHSDNGLVVQFDNCNTGPLAAGRTCVVLVSLPDDSFAACIAKTPIASKLRGTFEVRETTSIINPSLRVLVAGDLVKK